MMGRQQRVQKKLFYTKFSLDQRIPKNHILTGLAGHPLNYKFLLSIKWRNTKGLGANLDP